MRHATTMMILGLAAVGILGCAKAEAPAGGAAAAAPADAPELAQYERTGAFENCLSVNRIAHARILNKRQILFEMIDREAYLNEPDACPGLNSFVTLSYDATANLLCNTSVVRLVEPSSDVPSRGGCNLGRFEKLKKKAAAQ